MAGLQAHQDRSHTACHPHKARSISLGQPVYAYSSYKGWSCAGKQLNYYLPGACIDGSLPQVIKCLHPNPSALLDLPEPLTFPDVPPLYPFPPRYPFPPWQTEDAGSCGSTDAHEDRVDLGPGPAGFGCVPGNLGAYVGPPREEDLPELGKFRAKLHKPEPEASMASEQL